MPQDTIHIAFNIDSNYVRHCAVTMASIFRNNQKETFCLHIVTGGLKPEEKEKLCGLAEHYGSRVEFYMPKPGQLDGFTIRKFSKRISLATYYRCVLSDVLPAEVDRVIYLDCDLLVLGQLRPLWETPLDGAGLAAVEDIGADDAPRYEVLKYPMADSYFNAGVLLIDLDYWRRHDIPRKCVEYYRTYPERIVYNDQDILNSIFHDNKKFVDLRWNMQDAFYRPLPKFDDAWRAAHAADLRKPAILHFTNRKPWEYDNQHPLRRLYFCYNEFTPWCEKQPWESSWNRFRRFVRLLPFRLHLREPKYISLER